MSSTSGSTVEPTRQSPMRPGAAGWIATLLIASALVFFSGRVLGHNALTEDYGCPEAPAAATEECLDRQGFAGLVGPITLAVVFTLAAATVAGASDRRSLFRVADLGASTLLILAFGWFLRGREVESSYAVAGAVAWFAVAVVLAAWFAWRPWERVLVCLGAGLSSLLVAQSTIAAYG